MATTIPPVPKEEDFRHEAHFFITLYALGRAPRFAEIPALRRMVLRCWREVTRDLPNLECGEVLIKPWSLQCLVRIREGKQGRGREQEQEQEQVEETGAGYATASPATQLSQTLSRFREKCEVAWKAQEKEESTEPVWQDETHIHRLYDLTEFRVFHDFIRRELERQKRSK